MLRVEGLCCGYGGEPVVRGISFSLSEGERLAILGPNGCGKTTLLRAVMGILPFEGEVFLCGRALREIPQKERAREIAMFSQMPEASFSYTVRETVLLGRYPHMKGGLFASPGEEDEAVADEWLRRLSLWEERDRQITRLSGGQLQRVLLARTLAQSPKVLLLDEPTNHLDLRYQAELVGLLKDWAAAPGRAAVGVFHDIGLALSFADVALLIDKGRAAYLGPSDAIDSAALSRAYGMDVPAYMRGILRRWEDM